MTLTPNPSLDRTTQLDGRLVRGGVHRLGATTSEPGGKGVNVSRAIHLAGVATVAVVPAEPDDPLVRGLDRLGVPHILVPTNAPVRANLTLTEPDGTTTKLNEPGVTLSALTAGRIAAVLQEHAPSCRWVAMSGSLPPGSPPGWYAQLAELIAGSGCRIAVDTSDEPLRALAAHEGRIPVDLLKPNSEELGQVTRRDGAAIEAAAARGDWGPVLSAAHDLTGRGVGTVLVTLGPAGALLVTADEAWRAAAPPIRVLSTVGAGDSSLAGYLLAELEGRTPGERLARAVAYGSAAASLPGSQVPTPAQAEALDVVVEQV